LPPKLFALSQFDVTSNSMDPVLEFMDAMLPYSSVWFSCQCLIWETGDSAVQPSRSEFYWMMNLAIVWWCFLLNHVGNRGSICRIILRLIFFKKTYIEAYDPLPTNKQCNLQKMSHQQLGSVRSRTVYILSAHIREQFE
jgi:hypothetical protein